jgi:hypothetical protein
MTAGLGATPSSGERGPFRACAEAVSSREHASATSEIIEKPKNRRSILMWSRSGSSPDERASDVPSKAPEVPFLMTRRLLRLVHALSSDPGGNYSGAEDFGVGHVHNVPVQDDEIGVFAGRE